MKEIIGLPEAARTLVQCLDGRLESELGSNPDSPEPAYSATGSSY